MAEDYYKTLGVSRNSSQADIQAAYRKLAREYHPDLNPDDKSSKEKFQKIQQAYEVLNDPNKREMYDRYGGSFESMGAGGPGGATRGFHGHPGGFEEVDLSELFGERFGGGAGGGFADIFKQFSRGGQRQRSRAAPRRGADLKHEVKIPFHTAISGGEVQLTLRRGGGKTETIGVKIPPGIENGKKIRLRGQGEASPEGGKPGDILLTVHVTPHPCFQRRGKNLHLKVPVTLAEAALGGKVDVPTPKGTISLTIPPGTSSGKKLRVKGHGVVPANGSAGDLYAEIQIVLSKSFDDESTELVKKLNQRQSLDPRSGLKW